MDIKGLIQDDNAVSPVIGVILMVAITVILAAVIASFVLGLGGSQQQTPTASFDYDYNETGSYINITKTGGDNIRSNKVNITGQGINGGPLNFHDDGTVDSSTDDITAGETANASDITTGETVRIVWSAEDQESSATISTYEIPS